MQASSNHRPGEPLRSWLVETPVRLVDAAHVVGVTGSEDALRRLIDGATLTLEEQLAIAKLNSFSVSQWYEPVAGLFPLPYIEPDVAATFTKLLDEYARA